MSSYRKGARLEYKCRDYLKELGWFVMRSAGSKGPADIFAMKEDDALLIQVKSEGEASEKAILKLLQTPKNKNIIRQVWEWKDKQWNIYWSD